MWGASCAQQLDPLQCASAVAWLTRAIADASPEVWLAIGGPYGSRAGFAEQSSQSLGLRLALLDCVHAAAAAAPAFSSELRLWLVPALGHGTGDYQEHWTHEMSFEARFVMERSCRQLLAATLLLGGGTDAAAPRAAEVCAAEGGCVEALLAMTEKALRYEDPEDLGLARLSESVLRTRAAKALWELCASPPFASRVAGTPALMRHLLRLASKCATRPEGTLTPPAAACRMPPPLLSPCTAAGGRGRRPTCRWSSWRRSRCSCWWIRRCGGCLSQEGVAAQCILSMIVRLTSRLHLGKRLRRACWFPTTRTRSRPRPTPLSGPTCCARSLLHLRGGQRLSAPSVRRRWPGLKRALESAGTS